MKRKQNGWWLVETPARILRILLITRRLKRLWNFDIWVAFIITENLSPEVEVKQRIGQAKTVFLKMKNLLTNCSLNLKSRQRLLKFYIYSIPLYGCVVVTYTVKTINYLEACKMWFHHKMLRIPSILDTIKKQKIEYFGHILQGPKYELIKLIIPGKVGGGHRGPGREKISWLRNIRQWTGLETVQQLMRAAEDWEIWNMPNNQSLRTAMRSAWEEKEEGLLRLQNGFCWYPLPLKRSDFHGQYDMENQANKVLPSSLVSIS